MVWYLVKHRKNFELLYSDLSQEIGSADCVFNCFHQFLQVQARQELVNRPDHFLPCSFLLILHDHPPISIAEATSQSVKYLN